jgi:thiamine-phosphate pyrophosphorylase
MSAYIGTVSWSLQIPRFYPLLDTALLAVRGLTPVDAAVALIEAGARILQFRHKGTYTRMMFDQASIIARMCREAGTAFIVNDRADVALMVDAGVHVGQDDLAPADVRRVVGPGRTVGFSTHNEEQFRAALSEPADYLAFGPIFSTSSKENPDPVVGLAELGRIRTLADRPLVAIGGITRERALSVIEAGADALAVISDLYPSPLDYRAVRQRAEEWLAIVHE